MENLLFADYVVLGITAVFAVFGLFGGFSGALAFLAASVAGTFGGKIAWALAAEYGHAGWSRGLIAFVAGLLAFGLARMLVKKVVGGILRQPADALFGLAVSGVTGLFLSLVAIRALGFTGLFDIESEIYRFAAGVFGVDG